VACGAWHKVYGGMKGNITMNRFAGFGDNGGVPFEKFTPAISRLAKPENPTKPKSRLARHAGIDDDEDGVIPSTKGNTAMVDYDTSRGPWHAMLDRMARARQAITGESYAKAHIAIQPTPRFATGQNMTT
jgi:hypothetical protein